MSEQATEVIDTDGTVIDRESTPKDPRATALVVDSSGTVVPASDPDGSPEELMGFLQNMGFPTPIASPEHLRAAFDYQTKMFAAVLGENDYLYTVTYKSDGKQRNDVVGSRSEGEQLASKFKNLGAVLHAKPKKSGIVKLARALGITAVVKNRNGLPEDPNATYSFVEYEAKHEGTSRTETGVGWCDLGERNGRVSKHDVIATADTRAYNRAVLRLAGFGDVSAEELVAGPIEGNDSPSIVPAKPRTKKTRPIPDISTDIVVAACRAWAEAVASRTGDQFEPESRQNTRDARELRAKARRGDAKSAVKLGAMGLRWDGVAIDGTGYEPFNVGMPTVTPEQILEARKAAEDAAAPKEEKGWDLSSKGSDKDDEPESDSLAAKGDKQQPGGSQAAASGAIPAPSPAAENITVAQAKKASVLLKFVFGEDNLDAMRSWLKENCHAERTTHVRVNQFPALMNVLEEMKSKKEANANG